MSDWYDNKTDLENYDLEKSKSILTRAEQIKNMEDIVIQFHLTYCKIMKKLKNVLMIHT